MTNDAPPKTIQKTEWTNSLLKDLADALRANRDDETVRTFAKELMDDKNLPIEYLVGKVKETVGALEGERLEVLVLGRYMVEKAKAQRAKTEGGILSALLRKILR